MKFYRTLNNTDMITIINIALAARYTNISGSWEGERGEGVYGVLHMGYSYWRGIHT